MMKLKKRVRLLSAVLLLLISGATAASAETSFDVSTSFGKADQYNFGLSSEVKQSVTDELTIDSSIVYLISNEYEATLKVTHHVTSWFAGGVGFLLFTDESAMLPAFAGSVDFIAGKRFSANIFGGIGLNEQDLTKPYMFKAGLEAETVTADSIIDVTFQWQKLQPSSFVRTDYNGELRAYAISPDNDKMKVCLGLNGRVRMDSRTSDTFNITAGFLMGFDYGTPEKGSSLTFAVTPFNDLNLGNLKLFGSKPTWMVSSGIRFAFE